jgi:hypothetical protein
MLKVWVRIQKEHYRHYRRQSLHSYSQWSKEAKHYDSRCSTKRTRKKCESCGYFKFTTGQFGIPAAEVYIPIEEYNYTTCWACCSEWKNCCHLQRTEQTFRAAEEKTRNFESQKHVMFNQHDFDPGVSNESKLLQILSVSVHYQTGTNPLNGIKNINII